MGGDFAEMSAVRMQVPTEAEAGGTQSIQSPSPPAKGGWGPLMMSLEGWLAFHAEEQARYLVTTPITGGMARLPRGGAGTLPSYHPYSWRDGSPSTRRSRHVT